MNRLPPYVPPYKMLLAGLGLHAIEPGTMAVDGAYLGFLIGEFARLMPFDPAFYATTYPDIAAAAARGEIADLHTHFVRSGYPENRLPHPLAFDPDYYLARNPDLHGLGADAGHAGLRAHFERNGWLEGRTAHPAAEADAARWWQAGQRTAPPAAHRTIPWACVQAFRAPLVAGPPLGFRGGLVLGDTPADRRLRHRRGAEPVDSFPPGTAPIGRLTGEYVYGGPYTEHFGHAMAEMIHRVLPARALFGCRRLLFVGTDRGGEPAGFAALPPAMQAPLLFLGVDPADVTVIHDDRVVETLHVAEQGSTLTDGPSDAYLALLGDYTPGRLPAPAGPAAPLYVSRTEIRHGGTILGERYLESRLAAEGWRVFHPQHHALIEQMAAYQAAPAIVFAEGSACHGAELFGAGGLGHCVLLPRRLTQLWWIEPALRRRARRLDRLPAATPIGTIVADAQTGAPLDNLGVSVMDLPAVAASLRGMGLARLARPDTRAYRRAAHTDLAAYLAIHRDTQGRLPGTRLVDEAALAAFEARAVAAIDGSGPTGEGD